MKSALFLDRDGVIIENRPDYVRAWSDVSIYSQALSSIKRIKTSQYKIFIITNQSVVGRGLIAQSTAEDINWQLVNEIEAAGGRIDGVYMCPHAPGDKCPCRKPEPGMIIKAAAENSVDLGKSILIGDAISDIIAGQSAGVGINSLVKTGRGSSQIELPQASQIPNFNIYSDVAEALLDLIP